MRYFYSPALSGYHANLWNRIKDDLGVSPIETGITSSQTYILFDRVLTPAETGKLDAIMAANPGFPPPPKGTVFTIKDIWEFLGQFNTATGVPTRLYYAESVPGSGKFDLIVLHADSALTTQQKNKVTTEYGKLVSV